jgi:hypothetical protein
MSSMHPVARFLIGAGVILVLAGLLWQLGGPHFRLGRLPGDFTYARGNMRVYLPVTTSILLSVVFSLVMWLLRKL